MSVLHNERLIAVPDRNQLSDLKPENLASSASAISLPTKLVGVPPSKSRGGNQTPRSESIFITGSQPLPSPSSSFGSSPMLDKWAFGMSKINGEESKPRSPGRNSTGEDKGRRADSTEQAAERISDVSLDANWFDKRTSPHPAHPPGPSLLTQQAPSHVSTAAATSTSI